MSAARGSHGNCLTLPIMRLHCQGPEAFTHQADYRYRSPKPPPPSIFPHSQGPDAFLRQPYHQLRHPKIFYYGHPAVVYVNKFRVAGLLEGGIDPFIEQVGGEGTKAAVQKWHQVFHRVN